MQPGPFPQRFSFYPVLFSSNLCVLSLTDSSASVAIWRATSCLSSRLCYRVHAGTTGKEGGEKGGGECGPAGRRARELNRVRRVHHTIFHNRSTCRVTTFRVRSTRSKPFFGTPGTRLGTWLHPSSISTRPSILMSKHTLLSLAPLTMLTLATAAMQSPHIAIVSTYAVLSPVNSRMTHPVTTFSKSSSRLITVVQVACSSACRFSLGSRSYLQKAFLT